MDRPVPGRGAGAPLIVTTIMFVAGVAIAWIDSRPAWDDAGITAGAILVSASLGAVLGVRPWLSAILVVAPLLLAEFETSGAGVLIAPLVAFVGAYGGALARHQLGSESK